MQLRLELKRDEMAPVAARHAVDELEGSLSAEQRSDVRLLVSELVTNCVQHGDGDGVVVLLDAERPEVLRCEVIDGGNGFVPTARDTTSHRGWGLNLVAQLADSWGVRTGSTHVWFELGLEPHGG